MRALATLLLLVTAAGGAGSAAAAPAATPSPAARADTLFARRDWKGAAAAYEAIARREPDSFRAWFRLGASHHALERWDPAIAAYRNAQRLEGFPFVARYNLACAFARSGRRDSALATLHGLVDRGYRQAAQLEADADFESLRADSGFRAILERARRNAEPCAYRSESRQFDFWIGEWDVFDPTRGMGRAGSSRIERILGQCVLLENWTGALGGSGKSFNLWNPDTGCWQQTWVDDSGRATYYDRSRIEGASIVFLADAKGPGGAPLLLRLTFTPLGPDEVRQWGENSSDGGATWTTAYDLLYRRRR